MENSGQGTIQITLDMFLTSDLKICGEVELRVHQFLMSRTGLGRGLRCSFLGGLFRRGLLGALCHVSCLYCRVVG